MNVTDALTTPATAVFVGDATFSSANGIQLLTPATNPFAISASSF